MYPVNTAISLTEPLTGRDLPRDFSMVLLHNPTGRPLDFINKESISLSSSTQSNPPGPERVIR